MSEIKFFIEPAELFEIILPIIEEFDANLIFRRYEVNNLDARFDVIKDNKVNLSKKYNENGYSKIFISLDKLPNNKQDWDFVDFAENELLEISGLRLKSNKLEISVLRTVAKKSTANKLFSRIKKVLTEKLKHGGLTCAGTKYEKTYYTDNFSKYILCSGFSEGSNIYTVSKKK